MSRTIPPKPDAAPSFCRTCWEWTLNDVGRPCLFCGVPTTRAWPHARPPRPCYLNDVQVRALHRAHVEGLSLRAISRTVWEKAGYRSANSALEALRQQLRNRGLEVRTRDAGWRLVCQQQPCHGTSADGQPCRMIRQRNGLYCYRHAPRD